MEGSCEYIKYAATDKQPEHWTWMDSWDKRIKQKNMDMRFGMWNIRRFYRAGSLMTVLRELSR
jgi:hypothetical protein